MKKIEPYVYFQKGGKFYLLFFVLEEGKYKFFGQYDQFYGQNDCFVFIKNGSPSFTAVFEKNLALYTDIKGSFVGFGNGMIYFENEQKNLFALSDNRHISLVAQACSTLGNIWENEKLLFKVCLDKSVEIVVKP